jgi:MOSC domain-containing protein YiiM
MMRVISVNVGLPVNVTWQNEIVSTGIFKDPVSGLIPIRRLNLDGDAQADLTVHGGPDKAVYAYPVEHYSFWKYEHPNHELKWGAFGENLSTEGLLENEVCVGDEYRIGTARLGITQPRMPCYKLGIRFGDMRMVRRFLISQRLGIYFAVLEEGEVQAGDAIELVRRDPVGLKLSELLTLILDRDPDPNQLHRALDVAGLAAVWRTEFEARLVG